MENQLRPGIADERDCFLYGFCAAGTKQPGNEHGGTTTVPQRAADQDRSILSVSFYLSGRIDERSGGSGDEIQHRYAMPRTRRCADRQLGGQIDDGP